VQEAADAHLILICRFLMYLDDTQYKHLKNALDLRNGCGHPTGYQPDPVKLQGYYSDIAQLVLLNPRFAQPNPNGLARSVRSSFSEGNNLPRDRSTRLVVHAHDQQSVWMPLVVDSERRDAQLRTTAPERSRETGPSNSRSAKRSMHCAMSASRFAAAVGFRSLR